ncbi:MAG: BatD family protein [Methanolobus sp.]|nr:BatD family protein [Methanolobus sp.]
MILSCIALAGSASAAVEVYNSSIEMGNGYQINNYVIDVTDVFVSANSASFYVYEQNKEVKNILLNTGDFFEFDFEGRGKVKVTLRTVSSGIIPRAGVSIVLSNYNYQSLYKNDIVNGGHEFATYSGTPELRMSKTIDKSEIGVGDIVRVTVTVENVGDDKAVDVIFQDPQQARFLLYETFVTHSGQTTVDVGESKTLYVYQLKATEAGTYTLSPTTASFSNTAGQKFPLASSNSPVVTVGASEDLVNAELEVTTILDRYAVSRNEDIQGTIRIKNTGDAPATGVTVSVQVPDGMELIGSSDIETISGVPTIYLESFGVQQEREFSFTLKPQEVGTYTLSVQNSYRFNNGVDAQLQQVSSSSVTENIYVSKGKYDYLFEQPIYVYLVPLLIIGLIAGWIYYRHKQYKF